MKPASAKSRILGRLVSVLLVPVVLSSSVTTVYVSADGEDTIEAQVTEPVQEPEVVEEKTEETQVIEEEVVKEVKEVEETKETEETEETKTSEVETGDEVVEGTPKTAEEIEAEAKAKAEERAAALAALLERFGVASEEELAALAALTDEELTEKGYSSDDISALRSWFGGEQETEPEQPEEVIVEPSEEEITEGTEESEEQQELTKEEILEKLGISEEEFEELSAIVSIDELVAILQERGLSEEEIDLFLSLFDEEDLEAQLLESKLESNSKTFINVAVQETIVEPVVEGNDGSVPVLTPIIPSGDATIMATVQSNSKTMETSPFSGTISDLLYQAEVVYGFGKPFVSFEVTSPSEEYEIRDLKFNGVESTASGSEVYVEYAFENEDEIDTDMTYVLSYNLVKASETSGPVDVEGVEFTKYSKTFNDGNSDVYYSTNSNDLSATLKGTVPDGAEVYMYYAGGNDRIYPDSNGKYIWKPSNYGTYKLQKVVVKTTEWRWYGRHTEEHPISVDRAVCYYSDNETPGFSLTASPELGSDDWFTTSKYHNGYKITIKASSYRMIKAVNGVGLEAGDATNNYNAGDKKYHFEQTFTIPIDNDGTFTYDCFSFRYEGKDSARDISNLCYVAKIDCNAPSDASIGYEINSLETNAEATVTVPAECDRVRAGEVSAIYKVEYSYSTCLMLGDNMVRFWPHFGNSSATYTIDENGNAVFTFGLEKNFLESIVDEKFDCLGYMFTNIQISDAAGNKSENAVKNKSWFYWDGFGPSIVIDEVEGGKAYDTPEEILMYDNDISFNVNIHDYTLNEEATTVVNVNELLPNAWANDSLIIEKSSTRKIDERITDIVYNASTNGDGRYKLYAYSKDATEFEFDNEEISKTIVIDTNAPLIHVRFNDVEGDPLDYYNSKNSNGGIKIDVTVEEPWLIQEKSVVRIYKVDKNGNVVGEPETLTDWVGKWGETDNTISKTITEDGFYQLEVIAEDCLHEPVTYRSKTFVLDRLSPTFEVDFDKSNVRNGKYYNTAKIITVTAHDLTFDNASPIEVKNKYGNYGIDTWVESGEDTYVATLKFEEDGYYSFKVTMSDKAGNDAVVHEEEEFVVDKTAPEIKVAYDFNEPRNGMYYRTARTANVDIEDISFDSDLVKVTSQPLADITELPQLGGFSSNEKQNYASMTFANDGTYGYIINCEDLAGNSASSYTSDVFVIDTTAPEVKFAGVENFSANNGTVAPSVTYVDKYMDMDATTVTMTGSNNGAVTLGSQIAPTENGFVVSYADFERVKSMDDLYTLNATVYDLAGNETKEQLVFSVNRFGSVFVLGDAAKALNEEYYTNEPKDVSITEINVDELTYKDVSISRDGDVKELKNGKQYQVSKQGSDTSWKTYTYTISKDNFKKDGVYSVTVYTKDRATNVQDNKSRDAEINFAVDQTAPSIVAAGLKSGETYKEASHTVNIDVTDNMGVTNLTVYKDGKEIGAYDADALETAGGVESITLTESDKKQTVTIVAEDVAGNVETVVYDNILVSTKEPVQIIDDPTPESPAPHNEDDRPIRVIVFVIIALVIVAAGAGAGITIYKKKAENQ